MKIKKVLSAALLSFFISFLLVPASFAGINDNLIAYYDFDGNADDSSGNENHASVYGATVTEDVDENTASAYEFDGTDDYISAPHDSSLNLGTGDFSVTFWIKMNSVSGDANIINKKNNTTSYGFSVVTGNYGLMRLQMLTNGYYNVWNTGYCISVNTWTHVAITVDRDSSSGGKMYFNGVLDSPTFNPTYRSTTIDCSDDLMIGIYGSNNPLNGCLDEIRIYNRELTSAEVSDIYSLESSGVNYIDTDRLEDTNSNGYEDIVALFREDGDTIVRVIDSYSGAQIGSDITFYSSSSWSPKRITVVDADNDGHEDIAVMAVNFSTDEAEIKIYDLDGSVFIEDELDLTGL